MCVGEGQPVAGEMGGPTHDCWRGSVAPVPPTASGKSKQDKQKHWRDFLVEPTYTVGGQIGSYLHGKAGEREREKKKKRAVTMQYADGRFLTSASSSWGHGQSLCDGWESL